ncbi:MAG: anti-sigma factor domain-containing protein, partial [Bacillota bacterium]|nr:anti-sigma factor domain-containing protein [Bacillota bacterium]
MKYNSIDYDAENSIDSVDTENYDIGVIYEIYDTEVIVLNSKGQFIFIPRKDGAEIGYTVKYKLSDVLVYDSYYPEYSYAASDASKSNHVNPAQHGRFSKLMPVLFGAAAVLIAAIILLKIASPFGAQIYGYIDIDVNPSTSFEFDKDLNVIDIVALNNDSTKVINGLDLCGKPLNEAFGEYMKKLISYGFINKKSQNFVLLSAALNDGEDKTVLSSLLADTQKKVSSIAKSQNLKIRSEALSLTSSDKKASFQNKMSMGKYYLYLKAKESGNLLDKESLKDTSVYRLAELAGLFGAEQKEAPSASPDTNNKDIKLAQSTPNTSDAKPVITNIPKSTYEALPLLPKETNFLYTNKPATKNTDGENRTTPTPDLGKDTNTNPVPSNGSNIESSPPKVALNRLKLEFYT